MSQQGNPFLNPKGNNINTDKPTVNFGLGTGNLQSNQTQNKTLFPAFQGQSNQQILPTNIANSGSNDKPIADNNSNPIPLKNTGNLTSNFTNTNQSITTNNPFLKSNEGLTTNSTGNQPTSTVFGIGSNLKPNLLSSTNNTQTNISADLFKNNNILEQNKVNPTNQTKDQLNSTGFFLNTSHQQNLNSGDNSNQSNSINVGVDPTNLEKKFSFGIPNSGQQGGINFNINKPTTGIGGNTFQLLQKPEEVKENNINQNFNSTSNFINNLKTNNQEKSSSGEENIGQSNKNESNNNIVGTLSNNPNNANSANTTTTTNTTQPKPLFGSLTNNQIPTNVDNKQQSAFGITTSSNETNNTSKLSFNLGAINSENKTSMNFLTKPETNKNTLIGNQNTTNKPLFNLTGTNPPEAKPSNIESSATEKTLQQTDKSTETKSSTLNFFTKTNETANTTDKNNTKPTITFGLDNKLGNQNSTKNTLFGDKQSDNKHENPIQVTKPETSDQVKANELFSKNLPKIDVSKEDKKAKEDFGKAEVPKEEIKISAPKEIPHISKTLDEVALDSLKKKSIEDVINRWKNDLDSQVDRFESSGEKLKHFELMFQKNFESICSLYELIHNLKEEGTKTVTNLQDLLGEEDQIIEQLNIMEKSLDQYLEIADKREEHFGGTHQFDNRNEIYYTATEISKTVDEIQKEIDEVNNTISESSQPGKHENLNSINYEHPRLRENLSIDKNELTNILNSFYSSLRSMQYMEQTIISKLGQVETEINERKQEKEKDRF